MAGGAITLTAEACIMHSDDRAWECADRDDACAIIGQRDMDRMGIGPGGIVEIVGSWRAAARCVPAPPASEDGAVRVSRRTLDGLGVDDGAAVLVRRAGAADAQSVTLAPLGPVPPADARYLAGSLHGMPLVVGGRVGVRYLPDPSHRVWFQVAAAEPAAGVAVVADGTDVRAAPDDAGSRAVPPVPLGVPAGLASDLRRVTAEVRAQLAGRPPGPRARRPGGALCGATYPRALFLVRAAAAACGAHLAEISGGSLAKAYRHGRGRRLVRSASIPIGGRREKGGRASVTWWPEREAGFLGTEAPRAFAMAERAAPSVVLLDLQGWRPDGVSGDADWLGRAMGRGRDAYSSVARLAGGPDGPCRVALVALVDGSRDMPRRMAESGRIAGIAVRHRLPRGA